MLADVARAAPAAGLRIVELLADGEPVEAGGCSLIDSPLPVVDTVLITDGDDRKWLVRVPQPDCLGYELTGSLPLQALPVSGVIADVLRLG